MALEVYSTTTLTDREGDQAGKLLFGGADLFVSDVDVITLLYKIYSELQVIRIATTKMAGMSDLEPSELM